MSVLLGLSSGGARCGAEPDRRRELQRRQPERSIRTHSQWPWDLGCRKLRGHASRRSAHATFDGQERRHLHRNCQHESGAGTPFSYTGSYAIASNCYGPINFVTGNPATYTLVVWGGGNDFATTGSDATYVYSGSGNNAFPAGCATATLSGAYSFTTSGSTLSGTTQTGSAGEEGVFQFDGQGKVTASYAQSSGGTSPAAITATGTYSVTSGCLASATLVDSNGATNTLNFVLTGNYGASANVILANPQFVRTGSAHAAFLNPTESIGNVFSYAVNSTPPGSVFVLYGTDLATKDGASGHRPISDHATDTKVTVNGVAAAAILRVTDPDQRTDAVGYPGWNGGIRGGSKRNCHEQRRGGLRSRHGDAGDRRLQQQSRGGDEFGYVTA